MNFANPTYLWALLGLLVPLAIHFWSNKKGKVIKIGSTKFLRETDSAQSSSIILNEYWLLFLRLLMLAILALIMAEPLLVSTPNKTSITYLVEPSLLKQREFQNIKKDLLKNAELRLLQTGLAKFDLEYDEDDLNVEEETNYWQLIGEMESLNTDSIVIFTSAYLKNLNGKRPTTNVNANWIVIEQDSQDYKTLALIEKDNSFKSLGLGIESSNLTFKTESISEDSETIKFNNSKDSAQLIAANTIEFVPVISQSEYKVLINYPKQLSQQAKYVEAMINSISSYLDRPFIVEKINSLENANLETVDLLIDFNEEPKNSAQLKTIQFKPDDWATQPIVNGNNINVYYLTALLDQENIVEHNLLERFIEIMDFNRDLQAQIKEKDLRSVDTRYIEPNLSSSESKKSVQAGVSLAPWFAALLGLIIILERILAKARKQ